MDDFYLKSPRKGVSSAALIFNSKDELLIVKPSYKDHWSLPGGISEKGETPWQTCLREVKEEIGITVSGKKDLACVSYSVFELSGEKREYIQFVFYWGVLPDKELRGIKVDGQEIINHKFVELGKISDFLSEGTARRVLESTAAGRENRIAYLESLS